MPRPNRPPERHTRLSAELHLPADLRAPTERLLSHYGIVGVKGAEMRRTMLPAPSHRGGVMTMPSER